MTTPRGCAGKDGILLESIRKDNFWPRVSKNAIFVTASVEKAKRFLGVVEAERAGKGGKAYEQAGKLPEK